MLSWAQKEIADSTKRFRVVVAGRRFGKTHLAIREICKAASQPNREVWYVAPTYRQSKTIVWRKLKDKLNDLRWTKKVNESELTIVLKNNSVIALKGADNADSLRGVGLDFVCLDEFADIDPVAFYEVLRPTLADKQGSALFIGTPKGVGNWAHDIYTMPEESPDDWDSFQYTTLDGGNVTADEVETAMRDLDERTFRQEFLATFETYQNKIYHSFERKQNIQAFEDATPKMLYIGMDFNIDPMSAVIFHRNKDVLHIIDEIRIFGSNTNEMVDEIKSRYPDNRVWVFPDPAGKQRKTSAGGMTDIRILQNEGFIVKAHNKHTPVRDRINAVNSRLCSALGEVNLYIDPKCKHTIEGLERHSYKTGTNQPDKDSGYDHMMDALGYCVDYLFPITRDYGEIEQPRRWGHNLAGVN